MSVARLVTCDRCGASAKDKGGWSQPDGWASVLAPYPSPNVHLCKGCFSDLKFWLEVNPEHIEHMTKKPSAGPFR